MRLQPRCTGSAMRRVHRHPMTAIVFTPAHSWVGAHRVPMIVLSFAITLAVAATFAIVLFAASSSPPTTTTVPVQDEEPIGTHVACGLGRLVGC
jgi:hypothetical protein